MGLILNYLIYLMDEFVAPERQKKQTNSLHVVNMDQGNKPKLSSPSQFGDEEHL